MTLSCIYEKGILRPLTPPELKEGEQVEVIVLPQRLAGEQKAPAQILAEIAALPVDAPMGKVLAAIASLPLESNDHGFSGQDHDKVLYGENGAR